ncbi:putative reverse transcriptase domain-containing protein [Tanacetum coccineum]
MVNVIPPDHVDDVPVVEPNQHDDVPVDPEPIIKDEDEDPEEVEFEEEEDPQEKEDDMEVDIKEDENELELTYPYEEVDPLNPLPPVSESKPDDEIKVENPIEHEDETVPVSIYEDIDSLFGRMVNFSRRLYERETVHALVEKKGKEKDKFYGKLILDLGNEVRSSVEQGTTAMEKLVEMLGNAEEKAECKKLKKELEEERGFVFEERPNEAIDVPIAFEERLRTDSIDSASDCVGKKSPSSEPQGSPHDAYVDAAIAVERARHANVGNDARGSGPVRGQDAGPAIRPTLTWWNAKVATMGLETVNQMPWTEMKQLMTAKFCPIEELQRIEHELWNLKVKEYNIVVYTQRFNELALMYPRMVDPESVKVDAYIKGFTDNIKGEVTFSKPANLNEAVRMAYKLIEQKSQARDERILEGKKRKWESFQSGNSSSKSNQKDNSSQTLQNNQKQGNA